jgi:hypothetical protein
LLRTWVVESQPWALKVRGDEEHPTYTTAEKVPVGEAVKLSLKLAPVLVQTNSWTWPFAVKPVPFTVACTASLWNVETWGVLWHVL